MAVKTIPDGYHSVTPYIICKGAAEAIEFYQKAFGATVHCKLVGNDNKVGHAEIQIGNSRIMLADEHPDWGAISPSSLGNTPVNFMIYVDDVDAYAAKAVAAGLTVRREIQDQFYGDRSGCYVDPFGHNWTISTHKEDVSDEEMNRRWEAMMKGTGGESG